MLLSTTLNSRTLTSSVLFAACASAWAGNGLLPAGNSAGSLGRGGVGLAIASDAQAMADNPALMHQAQESVAIGFSFHKQEIELDMRDVPFAGLPFTGRRIPSDNETTVAPGFAYTSAPIGAWQWGVQLYDMGGLNGEFRTGPVPEIRPEPQTVNLRGRILAASLSWAATPEWNLGISALAVRQTFRTRNLLSTKALGTGQQDSVGYGLKLGSVWQASDELTFGATLQPRVKMSRIDYLGQFLAAFGENEHASIDMPTQFGVGVKLAFGSQRQTVLAADVMQYQWSKERFYNFFGWKDQTVIKLGVEHQATDRLTLRAGVNYGRSPIRGGSRTGNDGNFVSQTNAEAPPDPNAPRGDGKLDVAFGNYPFATAISQTHFTVGFSHKLSRDLALNGFGLYSPRHTEVATGQSLTPGGLLPPGSNIKAQQTAIGMSLNYSFK